MGLSTKDRVARLRKFRGRVFYLRFWKGVSRVRVLVFEQLNNNSIHGGER